MIYTFMIIDFLVHSMTILLTKIVYIFNNKCLIGVCKGNTGNCYNNFVTEYKNEM